MYSKRKRRIKHKTINRLKVVKTKARKRLMAQCRESFNYIMRNLNE